MLTLLVTGITYSQNDQGKSLNNSSPHVIQQVENETATARPTVFENIPWITVVIVSAFGIGILMAVVSIIRKSLGYEKRTIVGGLNKGYGVGFTNSSPVKRRRNVGSSFGNGSGFLGGGFGAGAGGGW